MTKTMRRAASALATGTLAASVSMLTVGFAVAADSAPARKPEAASLRVDWVSSPYHAPFFLGIAKGWYREAGIELSINDGRGSGRVIQLVGTGSDTFGFAGADAVVRGVHAGVPVLSVATIMPRSGDSIFTLKKSGIARAQDLKGRIIASTPGGTSDALLPAFLAQASLTPEDVTIVPAEGWAKPTLLLQGKVDAMNGVAWYRSRLEASGGAVNEFRYADAGVQVVGFGLVTNLDTAKTSPDLVRRFVAVSMRAWEYAQRYPDEALAAFAAAGDVARQATTNADRQELIDALKLARAAVAGRPFGTHNESDWEAMQRQLLAYRVIKELRPTAQYLTNRFVD